MKYLSLSKHPTTASSVTVASNNDTDPVSSKVQFEAWVDKQQGQLERYTVCVVCVCVRVQVSEIELQWNP